MLEASIEDLEMSEGRISVRGLSSRSLELGELARLVEEQPELTEHEAANPANGAQIEGLASWQSFTTGNPSIASGTHIAVVEIDTETGEIEILLYVAVDDGGRILNHYLVEAQMHGALAQGIGQALFEEVLYDEYGQNLTSTLMDYALPSPGQVPTFTLDIIETPSPNNPLGVKGVGEAGTIGAPPTIVNAALDALAPFGIATIDMPLRPEKIWALLKNAKSNIRD
jgi:aerobic carbon-monoxide dehydrogenase large subunit